MESKILPSKKLRGVMARAHLKGKKIVFTNGCFDILHAGHIEYLSRAKKLGNILVVGLNTDSSVKKIKGAGRPINNQNDRAKVLASLYFVDYVTLINETTPERLIRELKPDILVKGGDWKVKDIVGADFVKSCGGRVKTIPFVKGYSTTSIINKIVSL